MGTYKDTPATENYDAGDDFNYEVWTANTQLTLCNVPWDAAYKDVAHFPSTNALNKWIDDRGDSTQIANAMYARVDEPISIDMPFTRAQQYNYVRVYNPAQPVPGQDQPKYYYYFIRGIKHDAPNTTQLIVQLDIWQTFIRQVNFGRAYIENGHIGMANKNRFRNFGRDYLTIPDGLDTGSEYVNVASASHKVMSVDPANVNAGNGISILAISTVDLHAYHGTKAAPEAPSARGSYIQNIPTGAGAYLWTSASEFLAFMADFSQKPWVTAGIVSITIIPDIRRFLLNGVAQLGVKNATTRSYAASAIPFRSRRDMMTNWRDSAAINNYIPERYRHLEKLKTFPYTAIEMTCNAGNAIILKPESWNSKHASILEGISILPPDQRVSFVPLNYNGRNATADGGVGTWTKDGDYLDVALFLSNFPTVPIVNNGQILALAQSARSIASQYNQLDWSQQRALSGNSLAESQAYAGISAGIDQTNNSIQGDIGQTAIQNDLAAQQALTNWFAGTASGAGMGAFAGPGGAAAGGIGGALSGGVNAFNVGQQIDASQRSLAQRTASSIRGSNINSGLGYYLKDSNKGYADWAAKGDYSAARGALDAKVRDTALTPHGMSGQLGGESHLLAMNDVDFQIRFKMIDQASIAIVGEYWLRYGYPVRRSAQIPNDLRVMDHFSYWKLHECYIRTAGMPEVFKQGIRGILEKGVTVWNNPDEIGVIDPAINRPIADIELEGFQPPDWEPEETPDPPATTKRKKKNMLVFGTIDTTAKYALAGTSPGTEANWIETESEALKDQFLVACGVEEPVMIPVADFDALKVQYLAPLNTAV